MKTDAVFALAAVGASSLTLRAWQAFTKGDED